MNKKIIIALIALSIFLLTFYWFQLRPASIKASCQEEADKWSTKAFNANDEDKNGFISSTTAKNLRQGNKDVYSFCLHRNGL